MIELMWVFLSVFSSILLIWRSRSARGNNSLESAVTLTKSLRWEIQSLGTRIDKAASDEETSRRAGLKSRTQAVHEAELRAIIKDIKRLLIKIDDAVPLINLAITTSGATLSSTLPASVSTSRLLQGSAFLNDGDSRYAHAPNVDHQVGPVFTLSLYMLFSGNVRRSHNDEDGSREATWKEAIHKARVRLLRVPLVETYKNLDDAPILASVEGGYKRPHLLDGGGKANEYAYELEVIEDFDDDRLHSFDDDEAQPGPYKDVQLAGIRERIPIYEVEKIFYADTGRILNINGDGETNNPILLLRRNLNASPPRRAMDSNPQEYGWDEPTSQPQLDPSDSETDEDDPQSFIDDQLRREATPAIDEGFHGDSTCKDKEWRFPVNLDPEWLAFEVYQETEEDDSEDEDQESSLVADSSYESKLPSPTRTSVDADNLASGLSHLNIDSPNPKPSPKSPFTRASVNSAFGAIKTNLSLLEVLIRLTSLQQFEQASHLTIHDETINFFLEETSSTGKAGSLDRKRARYDAAKKVGFDPYDESPVKRHGPEYQHKFQGQDDYSGREQSEGFYSREGTPNREPWDSRSSISRYGPAYSPGISRVAREGSGSRSGTPQKHSESWLLRNRELGSLSLPSSPLTPLHQQDKKGAQQSLKPLEKIQLERRPALGPEKRDSGLGVSSPAHQEDSKK